MKFDTFFDLFLSLFSLVFIIMVAFAFEQTIEENLSTFELYIYALSSICFATLTTINNLEKIINKTKRKNGTGV